MTIETAYESPDVPAGFRINRAGDFIRKEHIKGIDLDRDKVVMKIVKKAKKISGTLSDFRQESFNAVEDFTSRSMEQYGAKARGTKGNMSLFTFDGKYKLVISVGETKHFDERLQVAKSLIDECIRDWVKGANKNIQTLIDQAFQVDRQGKVSVERILGLRQLKIEDDRWAKAMEAISDSIQIGSSKRYICLYERNEKTGEYLRIPLDAANA